MKKTLSTYEIADYLIADENANWSRAGAFALAEYLEELETDCGDECELDVVAIRCEFSEYSSLEDWAVEYWGTPYSIEYLEKMNVDEDVAMGDDCDEIDEAMREYIRDHGQLIEFSGGIIVSSF